MNIENNGSDLEAEVAEIFSFGEAPAAAAPEAPVATPEAAPAAPSAEPAAGVGASSPAAEPAPQPAPEPLPTLGASSPAPVASPAPAAQPTPAAPAPSEEQLRVNSLEAQLRAATDRIRQLETPAAPGAAAPAAPAAAPTEEAPPQYALAVPQQLLEAIGSDDPALQGQGITTLVNSLATNIHARLRSEFTQRLGAMRTELQQSSVQTEQVQQQERMRTEYYTDFPAHNNEVLKPIIAAEAGRLAAEYPSAPWDANFRAVLGSRVNAAVTKLTGQPAPSTVLPTPTPAAPVPPKPAAMMPTSAPRGGLPSFEQDQQAEIMDTFKFP